MSDHPKFEELSGRLREDRLQEPNRKGSLPRRDPDTSTLWKIIHGMQFLSCNMSSSMLVLGVCLIFNNYSTSARWIVDYNHLISNKREWNNCLIKNTNEISRICPDFLYHLLRQPIFSLFLILSRRLQLPYSESMV